MDRIKKIELIENIIHIIVLISVALLFLNMFYQEAKWENYQSQFPDDFQGCRGLREYDYTTSIIIVVSIIIIMILTHLIAKYLKVKYYKELFFNGIPI